MTTPIKTHRGCVWWEISTMTILVFLAVYAIVSHAFDIAPIKELFVSVAATCSTLWCIWVVRTFRNIMSWWIDIQNKIETACNLLSETKQEINEIKIINQGK